MVKRINKTRKPGSLQESFGRWALGLPAASAPDVSLSEIAHRLLPIRLDEIQIHAASLADSAAEEEQHELRKSIRRLRYTFETLGPCFAATSEEIKAYVKTLVKLQDLLGEMQDRTVLQEKLFEACDIAPAKTSSARSADFDELLPPDVAAFVKYGANRRARLLGQSQVLWKQLAEQNFLENLRTL